MNRQLIVWSVSVALGGLLFGLDTAVISGAEQVIQGLWHLSDELHGFAMAIALYGTVVGAMLGGIPSDRFGRKKVLLAIGILFFISALGSATAQDVYTFMFFRFIGGIAIGSSSVTSPMYISEIAPAHSRGRLVALFQFNIVLGIVVAYIANYLLSSGGGDQAWRWMLGWVAVPSLLFSFFVLLVPESPRWLLLKKNQVEEARKVLVQIDPATADAQLKAIVESAKSADQTGSNESLFSGKFKKPVQLAFLFAFFNQLSGINAIIYFAPRIFKSTGLDESAALLSTAGVGVTNFIFTMLALNLIDRYGRRSLMLVGSVALVLLLSMVSLSFFTEQYALVPWLIFGYIAFFAISQGAVIWVFISEIFPNSVRASGQALGSFTHWIFAAVISNAFPWVANHVGGAYIFGFFALMMVFQLIFVVKLMPETKGVALEDMSHRIH